MELSVLSFALLGFLLVNIEVGRCQQDCKVIAECDGQVAWKKWPSTPRREIEAEVEFEANVPVITTQQDRHQRHSGPRLYYYRDTLTWSTGRAFCSSLGERLCRSTELCVYETGGRKFLFNVISGDNWVPVLDATNEWLEIGDSHLRTCFTHGPNYGPPAWGTTTVSRPYKGYVYCCKGRDDEAPDHSVKYQYIGNLATYESSRRHCQKHGLRLCSSVEVCRNSSPVFGVVAGDMWAAVNDRENEWIEIGDSHDRTCWIHGLRYGPPAWGIRTDGSAVPHVGYVYCCN